MYITIVIVNRDKSFDFSIVLKSERRYSNIVVERALRKLGAINERDTVLRIANSSLDALNDLDHLASKYG